MDHRKKVLDDNIPYLFASARHTNVECILHMHVSMEIILVKEGVLNMTIGGKDYSFGAGYGAFVPPFETHQFHSALPNNCHVIMFSKELVPFFSDFLESYIAKNHIFAVSDESMSLAEKLFPDEKNLANALRAQAALAPLCYDIYNGCDFEERNQFDTKGISDAMEYMEKHFTEELDLERVARAVGQHPVTLSKAFAKKTNMHFHFYLQYLRCSYAARLIKSEQKTFTEIAFSAGFGSVRSFNRAFFNIYGVTPTTYKINTLV